MKIAVSFLFIPPSLQSNESVVSLRTAEENFDSQVSISEDPASAIVWRRRGHDDKKKRNNLQALRT